MIGRVVPRTPEGCEECMVQSFEPGEDWCCATPTRS